MGSQRNKRRKKKKKKQRLIELRHGKVGAMPGTLEVDPEAVESRVQVFAYGPDELDEREAGSKQELAGIEAPVIWINVNGLGDERIIRYLSEQYQLHPLAVEDVLHTHQRPKSELYSDHLFLVVRMVQRNGEGVDTEQVSLFLTDSHVVSFQEHDGDCLDPVRNRIRSGQGRIRKMGADYLAYAIVDAIIDHFYPVLEEYGEELEILENEILERPSRAVVRQIYRIRRDLLALRRAIWPLREALTPLYRDPSRLISDDVRVFFRDCYDHAVQIMDVIETYREITSSLLDVYLSSVSNRMNEVMKVLTIIATIFIPLSFIAGVYGMNFKYMPELGLRWGYFGALGLMLITAISLLFYFVHKGWIGGGDGSE